MMLIEQQTKKDNNQAPNVIPFPFFSLPSQKKKRLIVCVWCLSHPSSIPKNKRFKKDALFLHDPSFLSEDFSSPGDTLLVFRSSR